MTRPVLPNSSTQAAARGLNPVLAYGLAALVGAAFWASLLFAVF
ncbi:hypothetical protein HNP47_001800 [Brevundimonas vesicularis]|uniref:Uncharacterized protein n=1 Tax=Brevundimonas vesicularis TaxID=41276 RepID=A0A7W9FUM3_BREVE|nr:hypothetical protein [Brevundimonas vesicularis]MBB5771796.1 hypothetical protein [Brevundimonas vesicularis]